MMLNSVHVMAETKEPMFMNKQWGNCFWSRGKGNETMDGETKSLSFPNEDMVINKDRLWVFMFWISGHYKAVGIDGDDLVKCHFPGRAICSSSEECAKQTEEAGPVRNL